MSSGCATTTRIRANSAVSGSGSSGAATRPPSGATAPAVSVASENGAAAGDSTSERDEPPCQHPETEAESRAEDGLEGEVTEQRGWTRKRGKELGQGRVGVERAVGGEG